MCIIRKRCDSMFYWMYLSADLKELKWGKEKAGLLPLSFPLGTHLDPDQAGPETAGCPLWRHWCPLGVAHKSDGQNPIKRKGLMMRNMLITPQYLFCLCHVQDLCLKCLLSAKAISLILIPVQDKLVGDVHTAALNLKYISWPATETEAASCSISCSEEKLSRHMCFQVKVCAIHICRGSNIMA